MMFGRRKTVVAPPNAEGAYRIKLELDYADDWCAWIYDPNGKQVERLIGTGGPTVKARDKMLQDAKNAVDRRIERERLVAEAEGVEIWYGTTPEIAQKTISTQASYIDQLEAKLDEFRKPDGSLDGDAMVEAA